ncbi:MAG: RHS repeat-associated core domain-containing protein, partial [Rhizomicrobium sp.]
GNCLIGGAACSGGVPFKYTGRRYDPETGLYFNRARFYSAAIGRFLQTDPIGYGPDLDWYTYAGNDPTDMTDPWGLAEKEQQKKQNCEKPKDNHNTQEPKPNQPDCEADETVIAYYEYGGGGGGGGSSGGSGTGILTAGFTIIPGQNSSCNRQLVDAENWAYEFSGNAADWSGLAAGGLWVMDAGAAASGQEEAVPFITGGAAFLSDVSLTFQGGQVVLGGALAYQTGNPNRLIASGTGLVAGAAITSKLGPLARNLGLKSLEPLTGETAKVLQDAIERMSHSRPHC